MGGNGQSTAVRGAGGQQTGWVQGGGSRFSGVSEGTPNLVVGVVVEWAAVKRKVVEGGGGRRMAGIFLSLMVGQSSRITDVRVILANETLRPLSRELNNPNLNPNQEQR